MEDIDTRQKALQDAGWNSDVAEALAENDHNVETAKELSANEIWGLFLSWNGILDALDNIRNMDAVLD